MAKFQDLTGQKFNRLIVLQHIGTNNRWHYWKCQCDCGNIVSVTTGNLLSNHTKSCGCLRKENTTKTSGESAANTVFASYRGNARKAKLKFELTKQQFIELTQQNCYYCGIEPQQILLTKNCNGQFIYNGVDRVDNTEGYTIKNCVAACYTCNRAKNNYSIKKFNNWISRIVSKENKKFAAMAG